MKKTIILLLFVSIYMFLSSVDVQNQVQKLMASDGENSDYMGCSVDIDGNWLVVGAKGDNDYGESS